MQFDDLLILLCCCLSIIGTTYVMINYLLTPHLQDYAFKFVYNLSIANFLWTLSVLLNVLLASSWPKMMENNMMCESFAAIKLFSHLSGLLWTASIAQKLYDSIFNQPSDDPDEGYHEEASFKKPYLLCYGFPALSAIGLWLSGDYGHVYPWYQYNCFIGDDMAQPQYWLRSLFIRIFFYYVPIWFTFLYISYLIIRISIFLIKHMEDDSEKGFLYKLFMFPVLILICWVPMTIKKLLADFSVIDAQWLSDLDYMLIGLNGFLNSLVYSYHTLLQDRSWKQLLSACCCCLAVDHCVKREYHNQEDEQQNRHVPDNLDLEGKNDDEQSQPQVELITSQKYVVDHLPQSKSHQKIDVRSNFSQIN